MIEIGQIHLCVGKGEYYFSKHGDDERQNFQADSLKKIEQEFKAIYKHGKKALKELTVPIEEFVSI